MEMETVRIPSFSVIGKEGSTRQGDGFVAALWADANEHFDEIRPLAKVDAQGLPTGVWGLMSDFSRSFLPWQQGFTQGLYLAGVVCRDDAAAPDGWSKWTVPGFVYLKAESKPGLFEAMLAYIRAEGLALAGAVQDYTCPRTGRNYMLFPIEKMEKE